MTNPAYMIVALLVGAGVCIFVALLLVGVTRHVAWTRGRRGRGRRYVR